MSLQCIGLSDGFHPSLMATRDFSSGFGFQYFTPTPFNPATQLLPTRCRSKVMVSWSQSIATQHWFKHLYSKWPWFIWGWVLSMLTCVPIWMGDSFHGCQKYGCCCCRLKTVLATYCINIRPYSQRRLARKEALIQHGVYHPGPYWCLLPAKHDSVFVFPKTLLCHFDTAHQWPRSPIRAVSCATISTLNDTLANTTEIKQYNGGNHCCCNKLVNIRIPWPNVGQAIAMVPLYVS